MIKAVVDVNVILSGLIRADGPPGQILERWDLGEFELLVSNALLRELNRVLTYPKIQRRITSDRAAGFIDLLMSLGQHSKDPTGEPPIKSEDPNDDYLIALAIKEGAFLVSGDRHLLDLKGTIPVFSSAEFLEYLAAA